MAARWVILSLFIFSIANVAATLNAPDPDLSNEYKTFNRCFSLLTGRSLHVDSPYLKIIAAKKKSAQELCQDLISDVYLDSQGRVKASSAINTFAKDILSRMQMVHQSWFNRVGFASSENEFATSSIMDLQTGANYLTWLLLSTDKKASDLFLINTPPLALRKNDKPDLFMLEREINVPHLISRTAKPWLLQFQPIDNPSVVVPRKDIKEGRWQPEFVPTGELIGFTTPMVEKVSAREPSGEGETLKTPKQGFGGGLLGSHAYFATNTGLERHRLSDGGLWMHRRWSENIFKDFFCRDMPVLNEEDAVASVDRNSQIPFQKNVACMKCHHTMDNLAAGTRNLVVAWSGFNDTNFFIARIIRKAKLRNPHHTPLLRNKDDMDYASTLPHGQLNYRNVDGALISFNFSNLDELGKHISESKDYHRCLAKRYVNYFTGTNFEVLNVKEVTPAQREFDTLAENFYKHRNQRQLIKDIFASNLFTQKAKP